MALVYKDPWLIHTQTSGGNVLEIYNEVTELRAKSGCSPDGYLGDNCLFLIDSCGFANVYNWGEPAFRHIRPMLGPYPREDPPVNPSHQVFPLVLSPGDWGIPLAGLISRFADYLSADLTLPFDTDYDVCIYSFALTPWVHERVYAAAALNCHSELMPKAYLLRHIAVSMMYALHDKRPDMSELQVFQTLMKVHFRQLVITGRAPLHKLLFAEVRWVDASSV